MLVLSRKKGESLQIGEDVTVTIIRVGDGQVRIGIEAPREKNIVRTELKEVSDGTRDPNGSPELATPGIGGPHGANATAADV